METPGEVVGSGDAAPVTPPPVQPAEAAPVASVKAAPKLAAVPKPKPKAVKKAAPKPAVKKAAAKPKARKVVKSVKKPITKKKAPKRKAAAKKAVEARVGVALAASVMRKIRRLQSKLVTKAGGDRVSLSDTVDRAVSALLK